MKNYELINARSRAGYSQKYLGELTGVTGAMISELENCKKNPSIELAYLLSKLLKVEMDILVNPETKKQLEAILKGGK